MSCRFPELQNMLLEGQLFVTPAESTVWPHHGEQGQLQPAYTLIRHDRAVQVHLPQHCHHLNHKSQGSMPTFCGQKAPGNTHTEAPTFHVPSLVYLVCVARFWWWQGLGERTKGSPASDRANR